MEKRKNRMIHAMLSELKLMDMKPALIESVTDGEKQHARDLNNREANLLIKMLQDIREDRVKKMRGKIIHYLCLYGMYNHAGEPDYKRINRFVKNIGSRNPKKKLLYYLSPKEMRDVLTQVESMVLKEMNVTG